MRKPFLKVWVVTVVCLLLPLQAFATICWDDSYGNKYSVELGSSSGGKIALHGFVKISQDAPCNLLGSTDDLVGRTAPLFGTAVVVDSNTAVIGWLIISIDQDAILDPKKPKKTGCIGYREQLTLDLDTGKAVGQFFFDSELPQRSFGPSELTLSDECPSPQNQGNPNPLERFDK